MKQCETNETLADAIHRADLLRQKAQTLKPKAAARAETLADSMEKEAFDLLWAAVKNLVWKQVLRITRRMDLDCAARDDLLQEGQLILLSCARKFEIQRGFKFSTYLVSCLRKIGNLASENMTVIRVPRDSDRGDSPANILKQHMRGEKILRLDTVCHGEYALHEVLAAKTEPESPWDWELAQIYLARLPERERLVFELRAKDVTLKEIGIICGCSKERVRQLEQRARDFLKCLAGTANPDERRRNTRNARNLILTKASEAVHEGQRL